jgi:pimeloyl-ACP methyl ester carboxylesterase
MRLTPILGLVCLAISVVSCSMVRQAASRYPAADLDSIYENSQADLDLDPVILIHGFAGATLVRESDGATAWGAFFTKDSMLPSSPDGLTTIALDIDALAVPIDPSELQIIADDAKPVEMLETVRADAKVANINYNVYAALVDMVEEAGYETCIDDIENDSIQGSGPECFSFFYDWRQDNVGNAIKLGQFVDKARLKVTERRRQIETAPDRPIKFDIIAHSMGGLLTRYYLRYGTRDVLAEPDPPVTWAGAEHLSRVVLISTPNFGAMKVLKEVIAGQRYPVVKFEPAMLATWVSAYQLFPRPQHRLWYDENGYPSELEFADASFWRQNKWGGFAEGQDEYLQRIFPSARDSAERQDRLESFMEAAFTRARRLAKALDKHPESDPPVPMILFAADAEPTLARAVVAEKNGEVRLKFGVKNPRLKSPGDGSVTRASALADERLAGGAGNRFSSPIRWTQTIFLTDKHRTLLGNPTFQNNLLRILLETDTPKPAR